jgi:hypothetical protein
VSSITNITRRSRTISAIAAALTAAALIPAGASAATSTFGSSLNHEPANAGSSCDQNNLDSNPLCTHVGSFYPGTSGHVKAASNGLITKIKVRAQGPMSFRFRLVQVRHLSSDHKSGQVKVITQSRQLNANGPSQTQSDDGISPIESFKVHIKVHKGDEVAIDTSKNTAEYCSNGTPGQLTFFSPDLAVGSGFHQSQGVDDCLLLVQAVYNH